MSNYQQTSITGESWLRAKKIVIENPVNKTKRVRFFEEKVFAVNGSTLAEDSDILDVVIADENDLAEELEIIDPETGETTGNRITYGDFYAILFSAYMKKALERDSKPEPIDDQETESPGDKESGEEENN